ncbi:MAG: hypothetical protein N3G80_04555 [Candidatus Micrarchaeota archaeon]|nr:hypothetical protein [Candidatus Micrarchaeota archaeon]
MKLLLIALGLMGIVFANTLGKVPTAIYQLCNAIMTLLPIVSMLMIVFAAVVYAGGQMMGAETRARANVWATAALVGAIIGILIVAITPNVLKAMLPESATTWSNSGSCPNPG